MGKVAGSNPVTTSNPYFMFTPRPGRRINHVPPSHYEHRPVVKQKLLRSEESIIIPRKSTLPEFNHEGPITVLTVVEYFEKLPGNVNILSRDIIHVLRYTLRKLFPHTMTVTNIGDFTNCNHTCVTRSYYLVDKSDHLSKLAKSIIEKLTKK